MIKLKANFVANWIAQIRQQLTLTWGNEIASIEDRDIPVYWFESFRRTIAPQPRTIRIADDFHCPDKEKPRWKVLQGKILSGKDLNPHRSTAHRSLFNSDGLLAEWGVHHFHLGVTPHPKLPNFVERSGPIVFALVDERTFYAVNVYEHSDAGVFEKTRIIESLHRNWPEVISKYRLRGIKPEEKLSEKARRTIRKKGGQTPVGTVDGTVYGSIGGMTSCSGVKSESVTNADVWASQIRSLQNELQNQLPQLIPTLEQRGYTGEAEIEAELKITKDGYQVFFPKYRVRATLLLGAGPA